MNATSTTRQPWIHTLLVLTLSVLLGDSFTAARAAEKEVPPKVREGSAIRPKPSEKSDSSDRKSAMREGDAGTAARQGDRESGKPSAERDGSRDGEKARTGSRDGEGMKKGGERDGEGRKPSAESGQKPRKSDGDRESTSSGEVITLKVIDGGDTVLIGDEKVPMNRLRGFLSTFLPEHQGARVEVSASDDIPLKVLHNTVDAVRDNGNKKVSIKTE